MSPAILDRIGSALQRAAGGFVSQHTAAAGKVILAVFAHPDDETTAAGGTIARHVRDGGVAHLVCATRGEMGTLGSNGLVLQREELGAVRERELRGVLRSYGAQPPVMLGYRDAEVKDAPFEEIVGKVAEVMQRVRPDVVLTFGPLGISRHDDHIALHKATVEAFHRYRRESGAQARLLYTAIPKSFLENPEVPLKLDGPETEPTHFVDIRETITMKLAALRSYRSQEDAQWVADLFERMQTSQEVFHQVYPALPPGTERQGLWSEG